MLHSNSDPPKPPNPQTTPHPPPPDNFLRPNKVFSATEMLGSMSFNLFNNM